MQWGKRFSNPFLVYSLFLLKKWIIVDYACRDNNTYFPIEIALYAPFGMHHLLNTVCLAEKFNIKLQSFFFLPFVFFTHDYKQQRRKVFFKIKTDQK